MSKTIKHKKVKGKITTLKALPYKNNMAYIRMINGDMFEWLIVFGGKIYTSYSVIKPRRGETKLSQDDILQVRELMWAGATATIDTLLDQTIDKSKSKLDKEKLKVVRGFEKSRKQVERILN